MSLKVISFCLWGDKPSYNVGALKNAKLALELFPGWECWFYLNSKEFDDRLDKVDPIYDELYEMPNVRIFGIYHAQHHLMLSRFQAIDGADYTHGPYMYVDVMLPRDCDSRLCKREKEAVDLWLASDKQLLVLKDHPWHAGVPILGGLWGLKSGPIHDMQSLVTDFLHKDPRNEWQCDQRFLAECIWPKLSYSVMTFDPFCGGLNYPSPRNGFEFCGATHDENDKVPQEQIDMLARYYRS